MRFAFFQSKPGIGPVTNNNFRFARVLSGAGHNVDLVGTKIQRSTWDHAPDCVRLICLGKSTTAGSFLPLIRYLQREKPDFLLASGPPLHVASGLAKAVTAYKGTVVTRTHIETTEYLRERGVLNKMFLTFMLRTTKNFVDDHFAASRGAADDLASLLRVPKSRVKVLFNPAIDDDLIRRSHLESTHPWLKDRSIPVAVSVARLVEQKGIDILLEAFRQVVSKRPARLILLGGGPLEGVLRQQARSLGLTAYVDFHGHVENPYSFMRQADLFVLSANYEGFANVVAEALACGCPVVSTDAPSGPREILADGEFGSLVPIKNPALLGEAISEALDKTHEKQRLVNRGMRFHVDTVTQELLVHLGA